MSNDTILENIAASDGILTSLHIPRNKSVGCIFFAGALIAFSFFAVIFLGTVLIFNFNKIFDGIGKIGLQSSFKIMEPDVPPDVRNDFSNAYMNIFHISKTNNSFYLQPWRAEAINILGKSFKDKKISKNECDEFINFINNSLTNSL